MKKYETREEAEEDPGSSKRVDRRVETWRVENRLLLSALISIISVASAPKSFSPGGLLAGEGRFFKFMVSRRDMNNCG
jgi:hypothetical protein